MCQLPQGDGGNKAWSPGRARRKPLKPLRRESRTASAEPVCSCAFCYVHSGTRDRGCSAHPAFPAPSSFLGAMFMQTSGASRREKAESHPAVVPAPYAQLRARQGRRRWVEHRHQRLGVDRRDPPLETFHIAGHDRSSFAETLDFDHIGLHAARSICLRSQYAQPRPNARFAPQQNCQNSPC